MVVAPSSATPLHGLVALSHALFRCMMTLHFASTGIYILFSAADACAYCMVQAV